MELVTGWQLIATILATVTLILWMYRAYSNVHRLPRAHPSHSASMAVWSWFIPVINLWYPCRIMQEIGHYSGRFSHPQNKALTAGWDYIVATWWVLNIGLVILSRVSRWTLPPAESALSKVLVYDQLLIGSHVLTVCSSLVMILLLRTIAPYERKLAIHSVSSNALPSAGEDQALIR